MGAFSASSKLSLLVVDAAVHVGVVAGRFLMRDLLAVHGDGACHLRVSGRLVVDVEGRVGAERPVLLGVIAGDGLFPLAGDGFVAAAAALAVGHFCVAVADGHLQLQFLGAFVDDALVVIVGIVLDLLASPGSGKTSTILATIEALRDEFNIAVIEGDIASSVDSEKIKSQGIAAVQINTGGACHLESAMIRRAVDVLDLDNLDLVIIENVGNLVCPAEFDTGAVKNAMILSVPEGDDKPLKYPLMFQVCDVVLINKIDVLPYFDFDMDKCREYIAMRNPNAKVIPICAKTGEGIAEWTDWLREQVKAWQA
mgnify:CR=1 FL=1